MAASQRKYAVLQSRTDRWPKATEQGAGALLGPGAYDTPCAMDLRKDWAQRPLSSFQSKVRERRIEASFSHCAPPALKPSSRRGAFYARRSCVGWEGGGGGWRRRLMSCESVDRRIDSTPSATRVRISAAPGRSTRTLRCESTPLLSVLDRLMSQIDATRRHDTKVRSTRPGHDHPSPTQVWHGPHFKNKWNPTKYTRPSYLPSAYDEK